MTKFKVGDCAVYRGSYSNMAHLVNSNARVIHVSNLGLVSIQFPDRSIYMVAPDDLFPTEPTPKTYTLTPYIKPETVMINGVEYIMAENV